MQEGVSTGSPKWSPDSKRVVFYEVPTAHTFAARIYAQGMVTSQIVSVDVATGARVEQTSGPGLKVGPQYLSADRIAYLVKAGPNAGLAFTSGAPGIKGIGTQSGLVAGRQAGGLSEGGFHGATAKSAALQLGSGYGVQYTDVFPRFSRDGKLAISDIRNLATTATASISVMNADGSGKKVVFSDKYGRGLRAHMVSRRAVDRFRIRRILRRARDHPGQSDDGARRWFASNPRISPRVCPIADFRHGRRMESRSFTASGETANTACGC